MARRFVLYVLAYLVPTFLIGFFWHLRVFEAQYRALEIYRADVIIPLGLSSMLVQACAVAWAYPRLVPHPESIASSLKFCGFAALVAWSFTTLAVAAKNRMTSVPDYIVIESAFTVAQFLLVAPLLALVARRSAQP